jgi:integrase
MRRFAVAPLWTMPQTSPDLTRGSVLQPIAIVALGTGMRPGELCALRWIDVDSRAASCR